MFLDNSNIYNYTAQSHTYRLYNHDNGSHSFKTFEYMHEQSMENNLLFNIDKFWVNISVIELYHSDDAVNLKPAFRDAMFWIVSN